MGSMIYECDDLSIPTLSKHKQLSIKQIILRHFEFFRALNSIIPYEL